ncbi:Periplasmic nitrate reductase [Streptomyces chartreusis]
MVQVANQARVCHSSTVAGLGTSFGRGGATTFMQDLQHADCIVIQGSNFAEAHPVGFQWVMEAEARGATVIHVDPRYTRTSALADLHVPLRAGSDIAFLGGIIHHVLSEEKDFREYVVAYTNAATIISEDFRDTEDLDVVFSGLDEESRHYDPPSWRYEGELVQQPTGEVDEQYEERVGDDAHTPGGSEAHGSGAAQAARPSPRTPPCWPPTRPYPPGTEPTVNCPICSPRPRPQPPPAWRWSRRRAPRTPPRGGQAASRPPATCSRPRRPSANSDRWSRKPGVMDTGDAC